MAPKVLGIDLGTTNTCAAVARGDGAVVIPNREGMRTTPSVVGFLEQNRHVVGTVARRQAITNPENTVYSIKRFMGLSFEEAREEASRVAYRIAPSSEGMAAVAIRGEAYSPAEISALILSHIRQVAEDFLGERIEKAVITVPAYFNDAQRTATRDAARIAGLEPLRLINEPTASALAYGQETRRVGRLAVFDLGGGTFDLSILEVENGEYRVLSTCGDTHLGGDDIDQAIVDWLLEVFQRSTGLDLRRDAMALQRLKEAAERAKCELSTAPSALINLPFLASDESGPRHLELELTQPHLERLAEPILERVIEPCRLALEDARLSVDDIHDVILVGGSTRMPIVQSLVRDLFAKDPVVGVNPDEAVAIGAALLGSALAGEMPETRLLDVTSLSLGLETLGGEFTPLIPRNTRIPAARTRVFTTAEENQRWVTIRVFQGERKITAGNRLLGQFNLVGIEPAPRGEPRIEVTFEVDENGILRALAQDSKTGQLRELKIETVSGLDSEEIDRLRREADLRAGEDRARLHLMGLRIRAGQLRNAIERAVCDYQEFMDEDTRAQLRALAGELEILAAEGVAERIEEAMERVNLLSRRFRKPAFFHWRRLLAGQGAPAAEERTAVARASENRMAPVSPAPESPAVVMQSSESSAQCDRLDIEEVARRLIAQLYAICEVYEESDGGVPAFRAETAAESSPFFVDHFGFDTTVADQKGPKLARQLLCEELIEKGQGLEAMIARAMRCAPFPKMRANLAIALGGIGSFDAFNFIVELIEAETNPAVLRSCVRALLMFSDFGARNYIAELRSRFPEGPVAHECDLALNELGPAPGGLDYLCGRRPAAQESA